MLLSCRWCCCCVGVAAAAAAAAAVLLSAARFILPTHSDFPQLSLVRRVVRIVHEALRSGLPSGNRN